MGNVIRNLEHLKERVFNLEYINDNYYEWKKEKDEFVKHLEKKAKEIAENRTESGVRDDKQQVVSSSKGCY